mmetsp:Transcript_25635/g.59725  ORF Transcript_25635/g.59725 Transcript_25635/m.59725 type:complete len:515 (+) Transcript_25635:172-1716(+)|eukprot:CAMPEP_0178403908 /NCGR_PEP_ID=MMETSP0689_2-20121128/17610_1 /TAXON_ID=160604 /ORGANISM="Amphidinium massartii, Strain CS-259" /LENGTH=514 /DNA_ID=CAMNT_0020024875 /DNA_START=84 /DNA_END=1628 /DNA_ORIENTATION=-
MWQHALAGASDLSQPVAVSVLSDRLSAAIAAAGAAGGSAEKSSSDTSQVASRDQVLPRDLPFVGFLRHAPRQRLPECLERLLKRRSASVTAEAAATASCPPEGLGASPSGARHRDVSVIRSLAPKSERCAPVTSAVSRGLLQRRAPLQRNVSSPLLSAAAAPLPKHDLSISATTTAALAPLEEKPSPSASSSSSGRDSSRECGVANGGAAVVRATSARCSRLPEDLWMGILSYAAEVEGLSCLSSLGRGFAKVLQSELVWAARPVRIPPSLLLSVGSKLTRWLPAWRRASKLVLPFSQQLLEEVARQAPDLPVEVAWRFDTTVKGAGVEVLQSGEAVRRVEDQDLVVLGDAPLPMSATSKRPYMEVRLDERGEDVGDCVNDFGIGLTACNPVQLHELGSVADEVPRSWVIDFTQSSVVLSINNHTAVRGQGATARDLQQGDRVGVRVSIDGGLELYINGRLRDRFQPRLEERIPSGTALFPVLDLYGRTVQLSRTRAEEPCTKLSAPRRRADGI